jgi:hypothetical protein
MFRPSLAIFRRNTQYFRELTSKEILGKNILEKILNIVTGISKYKPGSPGNNGRSSPTISIYTKHLQTSRSIFNRRNTGHTSTTGEDDMNNLL